VGSAGPLAHRIASAGQDPTQGGLSLSGKGAINVKIEDLVVPLKDKIAPSDVQAKATVKIDDLGVTMTPPSASTSAASAPIMLSNATVNAMLKPGQTPTVTLTSALTHEGAPFSINGNVSPPGLFAAAPVTPTAGAKPSPLDQLFQYKPSAKI